MNAISAALVERRFARFTALAGLSLSIEVGERVALLGGNGAGKTTVLRIFARLLRPSSGSVRVLGHDPFTEPEAVLGRIGFLSHETLLYPDLSARENLRFHAHLHGLPTPVDVVADALERVRFVDLGRPVRVLSRGQQQRVALARALLHEPEVLLLDEPWSGLDDQARALLDGRLQSECEKQRTLVFTTHDISHGLEFAERVVVLRQGRIVIDAATTSVNVAAVAAAIAGTR